MSLRNRCPFCGSGHSIITPDEIVICQTCGSSARIHRWEAGRPLEFATIHQYIDHWHKGDVLEFRKLIEAKDYQMRIWFDNQAIIANGIVYLPKYDLDGRSIIRSQTKRKTKPGESK